MTCTNHYSSLFTITYIPCHFILHKSKYFPEWHLLPHPIKTPVYKFRPKLCLYWRVHTKQNKFKTIGMLITNWTSTSQRTVVNLSYNTLKTLFGASPGSQELQLLPCSWRNTKRLWVDGGHGSNAMEMNILFWWLWWFPVHTQLADCWSQPSATYLHTPWPETNTFPQLECWLQRNLSL